MLKLRMFPIALFLLSNLVCSTVRAERIILTGGPGVGKTTIIKALAAKGEYVLEEAARDFILNKQAAGIKQPWISKTFEQDVCAFTLKAEDSFVLKKNSRVFLDRSAIDCLSYANVFKQSVGKECSFGIQERINTNFYSSKVFLIENLGIDGRNEIRKESIAETLLLEKDLKSLYQKLGFKVISIPKGPVDWRVQKILSYLDTPQIKE